MTCQDCRNLEQGKPAQPLYWDRSRKGGVPKRRWNLIVPEDVDNHEWGHNEHTANFRAKKSGQLHGQ